MKHKKLIGAGFVAAVAVVIGVSVGTSSGGSAPTAAQSTPPAVTPAPAAPPTTAAPVPVTAATSAPAAPAMSVVEQQAVASAQGYLTDGQGFSYEGLLTQLTSSYGSGFSTATAVVAISYLHPDWNAQAVECARNYLADGQGFSRDSLIQQLTSSYGSGFTQAQAVYAVDKVGL